MLKTILIITISVLNLGAVESAYQEFLGYEVKERGVISTELGTAWNAPAMAGKNYVLMQPDNGAEVYIRFIENEIVEGYAPLTTTGWNATELLVQDPDALAEKLADSPFHITGPPADLWDAPGAPRALQVLGPGNEVLYLTRNNDFTTTTAVDRVFIMVLGGSSLDSLSNFYGEQLGLGLGDPLELPVPVQPGSSRTPRPGAGPDRPPPAQNGKVYRETRRNRRPYSLAVRAPTPRLKPPRPSNSASLLAPGSAAPPPCRPAPACERP